MCPSLKRILILLIVALALAACAGTTATVSTVQPTEKVIPTPASALVENFIWQTDGLFGYRMLRPANWESPGPSDGRDYAPPGVQDKADRIMLRVVSLQAYYKSGTSTTGLIAPLALFEQNSSLEGWTKGIEQMWQSNGLESTLLRTLPQAKIYSVTSPGTSDVQLVAYVVDQDQPLTLMLTAEGTYADLDHLQQEGILDDFTTMAASIQAIPRDSQNVDPTLSGQ